MHKLLVSLLVSLLLACAAQAAQLDAADATAFTSVLDATSATALAAQLQPGDWEEFANADTGTGATTIVVDLSAQRAPASCTPATLRERAFASRNRVRAIMNNVFISLIARISRS